MAELPRWILLSHRVATYGQEPRAAAQTRAGWNEYLLAAHQDTDAGFTKRPVVRSVLAHIVHRFREGQPTAIPAGVLMACTSLGILSFLLVPDDPFPDRIHWHIGGAFMATALLFLTYPRWQPPKLLGMMSAGVGSSMVHGMTVAIIEAAGDVLILLGSIVTAASAAALMAFSTFGTISLRRYGLAAFALGGLLFSLGSLDWFRITDSPAYAVSALFSSVAAVLMANALMGIRHQLPPVDWVAES